MPRNPSARPHLASAAVAALALALLAVVALPGGAAVEGNDADGEVTVTETSEAEPPRNRTLTIQFVENGTRTTPADLPVDIANHWRGEDGRARDEWSLRTDEHGTVSVNASDGPVRVAVDHPDWKRLHASFTLDGNLSLELPVRPADEDLVELRGVVRSGDGGGLAGAQVEVDPVRDCEEERCPVRSTATRSSERIEVNGTEVHIRWRSHHGHAYLDADEDGRFSAAVPEGTYRVEARAEDHLEETAEADADAGGTTWANLTLTPLPPDSVTLQGVVRNAATGEPVEGALVSVEAPEWGTSARDRTDGNGTFELATKPGHLLVEVRAHPGARVCPVAHDAEARDGDGGDATTAETAASKPACPAREGPSVPFLPRSLGLSAEANETRNLSLELQPEATPTATIQGWVLEDGTGEPVPNATVHLVNEETDDWGRVQVDENGSFVADVPAGYHTVRVHAPGHLGNATNVDVAGDETAEVVLRAPAGEPARGGCCHAMPHPEPAGSSSGTSEASSGTDGDAAGAGGGLSAPADGPATIDGGHGDLGRYQAASGPEDPSESATPAPSGALTAAALIAAAVGGGGRRLRSH